MGDGFFMVAVILSATQTPISSLLWLFLLIPAFMFFGKGFADVILAKQIRRRQARLELGDPTDNAELLSKGPLAIDLLTKSISGQLVGVPSVTDRTTRELK
jgi:hypothetical protein